MLAMSLLAGSEYWADHDDVKYLLDRQRYLYCYWWNMKQGYWGRRNW